MVFKVQFLLAHAHTLGSISMQEMLSYLDQKSMDKSPGTGKGMYRYVTPEDVPVLLEQHILKGEIVDWLWRGEMGFSEEEQKKSQEIRIKLNCKTDVGKNAKELCKRIRVRTLLLVDLDLSYLTDPNSLIGSASRSFQNEGLLSGGADTAVSDAEFGFSRLDFRTSQLAGSVEFYQRHVFLCHKNPRFGPQESKPLNSIVFLGWSLLL
uniref:Uncharacterized protein n=1 Tax=Quercus lobata TaxID=97700 RepID=A0A7N2M7Y8_QUELO